MTIADDEIRQIIARASELQSAAGPSPQDVEVVIQAGEAVGIPRLAMERALRERVPTPMQPPTEGDLTFAKSTDGKFYVARVAAVSGDNIDVQYLKGGARTATIDELQPLSLLPGERIVCHWPWWGAWTCTVMRYDAAAGEVTVTDGWGETLTVPVGEVWLAPDSANRSRRRRLYAGLIAVGATAGAAIGSLLTLLFLG